MGLISLRGWCIPVRTPLHNNAADRRELILIAVLTLLIAAMEITGVPSVFFVNIQVADIEPFYFALMVNFLIIGVTAFLFLRFLCPRWRLGFTRDGLAAGLKSYGVLGAVVALIGLIAFYVGLYPFDRHPSAAKVLVEGVVYYIGLAIVEELYVRGLLLNLIERLFAKRKDSALLAVVISSVIFGAGHIPGTLGQPPFVIVGKAVWTVGMGMFFGMAYKKTGNLWLPVIIHFLVDICALPYCFSSISGYANLTLYILVPVYIALGAYSLVQMKKA